MFVLRCATAACRTATAEVSARADTPAVNGPPRRATAIVVISVILWLPQLPQAVH